VKRSPILLLVVVGFGPAIEASPTDPEPVYQGCNVVTDLCALPFPSSVFTRVDPSTPSGPRVDLSGAGLGDLVAAPGPATLRAMVAFNRAWLVEDPPEVTLAAGREVRHGVTRHDFTFELPIWKADRDAHLNQGADGATLPARFDVIAGTLLLPPSATPDALVLTSAGWG